MSTQSPAVDKKKPAEDHSLRNWLLASLGLAGAGGLGYLGYKHGIPQQAAKVLTPLWKPTLGLSAAMAPLSMGHTGFINRTMRGKGLPEDMKLMGGDIIDKMRTMAKSRGSDLVQHEVMKPTQSGIGEDLFGNTTLMSPKEIHPGILAHEAGHIARGKATTKWLNTTPKMLGMLASLGSLFTNDEDKSLVASGAASALGGVTLLDEILASRKGSEMLQQAHALRRPNTPMRMGTRMSPYIGLPSYALNAAMPMLLHEVRKRSGNLE